MAAKVKMQRIEFSDRYRVEGKDNDLAYSSNELHLLFVQIEDLLRVYTIKAFTLSESNKKEYNRVAIQKYSEILAIFSKLEAAFKNDEELAYKQFVLLTGRIQSIRKK